MDSIRKGWFSEISPLWPGQCFSLEIEEVLHRERSAYQDIMIVKTKSHGRALILDGIIQCTEFDEFAYQEMISFLPLCSHPNPSSVLIVGGGDGGVAREVSKHPSVRNIVQVEIDERVVEVALHIGDGFDFIRRHANDFDVVITDSSDPIGPAECLFSESYFRAIAHALKPGGIVCSQAGTPWIDLGHVRNTVENCRKHFGTVRYAVANVPTYPCGQIGFMVGAVGPDVRLDVPVRVFAREERTEMGLRYYDGVVHTAAFVLPGFVREKLG